MPVPVAQPVVFPPSKGFASGKTHGDTASWDDYTGYLSTKMSVEITQINVIYTHEFVYGLEVIYNADGTSITCGSHVGKELPFGAVKSTLNLQAGEYLTSVGGKNGDIIDSLSF